MKHCYACLLVIALILVAGCSKDKKGTLQVTFRGTFGGDPLVMYENHDYMNGQRIQFTRSEFFASDLHLVDASGNTYPLSDIELISLSHTTLADATQGTVLTFTDIPEGAYSDLQFGYGVAADINTTNPSDYPSSSPLSNTGRYWIPWTSYIFSKTEGFLDTLVDGSDNPDLGFAYHTGTDAMYRQVSIGTTVNIVNNTTTNVIFTLDHSKMLGLPDTPIDIKAKPQNHNPQDTAYLFKIVDNLQKALTFQIQ